MKGDWPCSVHRQIKIIKCYEIISSAHGKLTTNNINTHKEQTSMEKLIGSSNVRMGIMGKGIKNTISMHNNSFGNKKFGWIQFPSPPQVKVC